MEPKFRKFTTSSGKLVLGGKSAENNEELVSQVIENELVLHTEAPGSSFCNIKAKKEDITKEDIYETAVFCAAYSQDWRDNHKDIHVQVFSGKDIHKEKDMKLGSFGVKKAKTIIAKKEDIEKCKNQIK
jgi:predicted ribosome quality control (RQC) complex YloA/Tae2 family protein